MPAVEHLILTVDYELFGNGSGNVVDCVTKPLERMADVAERHGARLEIFVEALEFDAMERSGMQHEAIMAVKSQLAQLVDRGHSLQLHLHPQWSGAQWQDGEWVLDELQWRTGDIDAVRLAPMLTTALQWLREAAGSSRQSRHGSVFRAGGWCIQPSREPLKALRSLNVTMDSSVAPGARSTDAVSWFDFRSCPALHWWPVDDDVCRAGNDGFLEVPIAVGRVNALRHVRARLQRAQEGEFCAGCVGTYRNRRSGLSRYVDLLQKVWDSRRAMLDFCALPAELLIDVTHDWLRRSSKNAAVPVVAIGHTKNFSDAAEREFDSFLTWAVARSPMQFSSYDEWRQTVAPVSVQS